MTFVGVIIGILIGALFSGFIIWIVGKLGWGLEVDGFVPAYLAAIVIAVVSWLVVWLLGLVGISLGVGGLIVSSRPPRHSCPRLDVRRKYYQRPQGERLRWSFGWSNRPGSRSLCDRMAHWFVYIV